MLIDPYTFSFCLAEFRRPQAAEKSPICFSAGFAGGKTLLSSQVCEPAAKGGRLVHAVELQSFTFETGNEPAGGAAPPYTIF
ncbi:MAG: hypothetical protein IJO37_09950 [Ruminiclostridium sp.]|nr:hypothetical protein [Ruminiclostridium sp.]